MTPSYVCIHGHFYQPPRENPFTGLVDNQTSAQPYSNWNERITAESYAPNLDAAVLDEDGNEVRRVDNYSWISHDFGPTLLSWLETNSPATYSGVIAADRKSLDHFGGHGAAMAHAYNHTILPLSNLADKRTQVRWGMADFAHRYRRRPIGMWLPETAVDTETLQVLADEGIEFTVLSPYQAKAVENPSGGWSEIGPAGIDPRFPYYVELDSGKRISVLFYDGPLSQEIAFNGLLEDGHLLARRLVKGEPAQRVGLSHVATDGETYGHHHRYGEMALAAAIEIIRETPEVELTNYAAFLAEHPARTRVEIVERSSWSCTHGVERWRSDCGCSTGGEPGWHQMWRGPLRWALDWLRDSIADSFQASSGRLLTDPWLARDAYVEVVLGGSSEDFLAEHGVEGLDGGGRHEALELLEIQHRAMLMYTSCGWFFNDPAGLETVFVLRNAGRVIDLTREVTNLDLEPEFLRRLDSVISNHAGVTGRDIYQSQVAPHMGAWPNH